MLKWIGGFVKGNFQTMLYYLRHKKILDSMTSMEQFRDYVDRVQPEIFLRYQKGSPTNRLEFQSVVNELHLNLRGIAFLDIGPGYGDSLDICHENGAKFIDFIDNDLFFFTYNRLKGFIKGYRVNHMTSGLNKLDARKYDLIWLKGATTADLFITLNKLHIRKLSLSHWLSCLERLASSTCKIIICPAWANVKGKRVIDDVRHNPFTDTMLGNGYVVLPKIEHHNDAKYPITFYKDMSCSSHTSDNSKLDYEGHLEK